MAKTRIRPDGFSYSVSGSVVIFLERGLFTSYSEPYHRTPRADKICASRSGAVLIPPPPYRFLLPGIEWGHTLVTVGRIV